MVNAVIALGFGTEGPVWRYMFAVCAIPAVCLFIGMLRMPESPRWLIEKGHHKEALKVLEQVRSKDRAKAEHDQIEIIAEEESESKVGLAALLSNKWLMRIVAVGAGLAMFQQLTGINTIMYFGTRVLKEAGMTEDQAVIANISFGVVAVIGGIIALHNMDRIDRRKTFMIGLTLTTTCHVLVAIATEVFPPGNPFRMWAVLILVTAFVLSMQTFLNIAVWVWLAEIFPLHMRGLGFGIAAFFGWTMNGILGFIMPTLINWSLTGTFALLAAVGVLGVLFIYRFVPETRGRSLEALEEDVTTGTINIITQSQKVAASRKG